MRYPTQKIEKQLLLQNHQYIAGVDEVGRGSWAGPLVAGAVILDWRKRITGIKDSKLLNASRREKLFKVIAKKCVCYSLGVVSAKEIDEFGLSWANQTAMIRALENLRIQPQYILSDALKLSYKNVYCEAIVDGDYKVTSIAAASIIAKVSRDQMLIELDHRLPQYEFSKHKGYGTKLHALKLKLHGASGEHRKSFTPVSSLEI